jgi:hypothetical protein
MNIAIIKIIFCSIACFGFFFVATLIRGGDSIKIAYKTNDGSWLFDFMGIGMIILVIGVLSGWC